MSTENGGKVDLGVLEEDDEFEEFPTDGKVVGLIHLSAPIFGLR